MIINIQTGYQFIKLQDLKGLREKIYQTAVEFHLLGTILLAEEGINFFLAGNKDALEMFQHKLGLFFPFHPDIIHRQMSSIAPFKKLLVKVKKEIISFGHPVQSQSPFLTASELKEWMDLQRPFILVDTRNDYEVEVGQFDGAIHLNLSSFTEFATRFQNLQLTKTLPVVFYCTGGIRCAKAAPFAQEQGYQAYQLEGGILEYFKQTEGEHFTGNCFVFDWRLSLDKQLKAQPRHQEKSKSFGRHQLPSA